MSKDHKLFMKQKKEYENIFLSREYIIVKLKVE